MPGARNDRDAPERPRKMGLRSGSTAIVLAAAVCCAPAASGAPSDARKPNILYLLADQWRAQALGFAGNSVVKTPHLDRLAAEGIWFANALSGCPVCSPYRATFMTGQSPLTHGVFVNDVQLRPEAVTIAEVLGAAGYDTGYIGKWHVDGRGRSNFIPRERRQGFRYWKVLECTHAYNRSYYYGDTAKKLLWKGYDAIAQTRDAQAYIRDHAGDGKPFFLVLSWGPPHAPYHTAPRKYRDLYDPDRIPLRPNVPQAMSKRVRRDLSGYYAHCSALDDCVGWLRDTLKTCGIEDDTILVFTADHGDLLGSHGYYKKQQPYEESVRVPLLVRYPRGLGRRGRKLDALINSQDIMPTLLGLCGVPCPKGVEGLDYSGCLHGGKSPSDGAALLMCPQPFGQWTRSRGGREYRAVRTSRYTYARDLNGPWLLFDNREDPYQMNNLAGDPKQAALQRRLGAILERKLEQTGDRFLPGMEYIKKWGYKVDATGTVPYTN